MRLHINILWHKEYIMKWYQDYDFVLARFEKYLSMRNRTGLVIVISKMAANLRQRKNCSKLKSMTGNLLRNAGRSLFC